MSRRSPFRVDTYCVVCHSTRPHYLKESQSDERKDCFECAQCGHLIFAPNGKAEGLRWYSKDRPRDPRKDPLPGDLLKDTSGQLHRVQALGPGETRDIALWRKAMRGATVIETAGAR